MKAAIHQPHYFPWIPYMNKIASVDKFILFDTVQLPRGKSKVLRAKYLDRWLTIPFGKKGGLLPIEGVILLDLSWKKAHIEKLKNAYRAAPHKDWTLDLIEKCLSGSNKYLIDIEHKILETLCNTLGIKTCLLRASDLVPYESPLQEYIIELLTEVGADTYLTGWGKGSKKTVDTELFEKHGIRLEYQDFTVKESKSLLDNLFMFGESTKSYIE